MWRDVVGYEGLYQVSDEGQVRSVDRVVVEKCGRTHFVRGCVLKPAKHYKGYLQVCLSKDNRGRSLKIHRLVAEAFIPKVEGKPDINHIDANKLNNHVSNLEWCTNRENHNHKMKLGLNVSLSGEKNGFSKLTEDQVKFIRENYTPRSKTLGMRALAKKFGVSNSCVWSVISGEQWREVV